MKLSHVVLSLSAAFLVLACERAAGPTSQNVEMTVHPYQVPCEGEAPMSCMLVEEAPKQGGGLFYDRIEGFTFEWGYRTRMRVERVWPANPPQGGPYQTYRFLRVVERTPVTDWEFTHVLVIGRGNAVDGDLIKVDGFRPLRVTAASDLETLRAVPAGRLLQFKVKPNADGGLEAHSLETRSP